ncbi:hypothetical protein GGX14DRAFT_571306 [Mycena pura]|uniref:Uncharacterized protein n=1 Tax=Mycena pura TaxID=153505 RepID=A0AAD6YA30_9AGAR|nr:hypothetical protein GGX14DRAFT_571306 [Mycena pura]
MARRIHGRRHGAYAGVGAGALGCTGAGTAQARHIRRARIREHSVGAGTGTAGAQGGAYAYTSTGITQAQRIRRGAYAGVGTGAYASTARGRAQARCVRRVRERRRGAYASAAWAGTYAYTGAGIGTSGTSVIFTSGIGTLLIGYGVILCFHTNLGCVQLASSIGTSGVVASVIFGMH